MSQGEPAAAAPASEALKALKGGASFARWTIVRVHGIDRGAMQVDIRDREGHEFALEILARDPSPLASKPPALTEGLAIYVRNQGDGFTATAEEQGLAAMTLAQWLDKRGEGGRIEGLLTHAERLAAHRDVLVSR